MPTRINSPTNYRRNHTPGTSAQAALSKTPSSGSHPNNENKVGKAYRIYSESELLSEKKGILKCEATESRKKIGTDGPLCIVIGLVFMKPLL